ncbi:MAG: hypothetical protein AAF392_00660, partial [Bacteroidota bacterium]
RKVYERLRVLNLPAKDLAAYRKYRTDSLKERDRIVSAKEEGREEGRQEGREEGREEEKLGIAKNMLFNLQIDMNTVQKATGLSRAALEALQAKE